MKLGPESLEEDILLEVAGAPNGRMRRRDIFQKVYPRYLALYKEGSFAVVLQRKLELLRKSGQLERDNEGHQRVYYSIPKHLHAELMIARKELDILRKVGTLCIEMQKRALDNQTQSHMLDRVYGFVENVYELLPRNAELVASTETEEERETRKEFYRKTGGKVQVSIPEKRRRMNAEKV